MSLESVHRWGWITISGAIQEYIEAVLFQDYLQQSPTLETKTLLSYEETAARIPFGDKGVVPMEDYLLGVLDYTGELMRYGITHTSTISEGATNTVGQDAIEMLRTIALHMDAIAPYAESIKSFSGKHRVLRESLRKIEKQVYADALNNNSKNHKLHENQDQIFGGRPVKRLRIIDTPELVM